MTSCSSQSVDQVIVYPRYGIGRGRRAAMTQPFLYGALYGALYWACLAILRWPHYPVASVWEEGWQWVVLLQ